MPREVPLQNMYHYLNQNPGSSREAIDAAHPTLPGRIIRHRLEVLESSGWIQRVRGESGEEYWVKFKGRKQAPISSTNDNSLLAKFGISVEERTKAEHTAAGK